MIKKKLTPNVNTSAFSKADMTPDAAEALVKLEGSRRDFFKAAGLLVVGYGVAGEVTKARAQSPINPSGLVDASKVDSWVAIGADESVTVYSGKCEFGQGIATVQTQLAADELYVPISRVKLIYCDTGYTPDQGTTSGSQSHIAEFGPGGVRQALATAREVLFQLAGQYFDVPVTALTVNAGVISVTTNATQSITYGQLLEGERFNVSLDNNVVYKNPATYTVLGTSVPRIDIPAKATGAFRFVQNVKVPGMLHGRVVRPPTVGSHVVSVNAASVAGMPGNPQVVVKGDFVGVVATNQWAAIQAAGALQVNWGPAATLPDQSTIYTWITQQPSADSLTCDTGDTPALLKQAAKTFSAQYLYPYNLHGAIAGSCAVADVQGGTGKNASAKIWSSTQGVYPQRDSAANLLGIPNTNVRVTYADGSGCYGLNGNDTVCYDAALMSQAIGAPVRVVLSRRDEMTAGENFGPAFVINLTAGVNSAGQLITWVYEGWSLSKGNRPTATVPGNIITGALVGFPTPVPVPTTAPPTVPASFSNNGNTACNYVTGAIAGKPNGGTGNVVSQRILNHSIASPFFTGPLRSPARLQNTFANEAFMDEIAASLGQDPVAYRLRHLSDPRLINVINAVTSAYGWIPRTYPIGANNFGNFGLPQGTQKGRGFSCVLYEGNNGYSAMIVDVTVNTLTGQVVVTKITTAIETGPISNPDGLKNQTEGGAMQSMSRVLYEQMNWSSRASVIQSADWVSYPVYNWGQPIPVLQTVLVNNLTVSQTGAGECAITLTPAAIGNAIFDATGVRIRTAPFTAANVLAAIQAAKTTSPE